MKVVFERKKDKVVEPELAIPKPDDIMKVYSDKQDVNIRSVKSSQAKSQVEPERKEVVSPVNDEIEYLKSKYLGVFGLESIIPSNKDVLTLNLLFAIYSELVGLREDLRKGGD